MRRGKIIHSIVRMVSSMFSVVNFLDDDDDGDGVSDGDEDEEEDDNKRDDDRFLQKGRLRGEGSRRVMKEYIKEKNGN